MHEGLWRNNETVGIPMKRVVLRGLVLCLLTILAAGCASKSPEVRAPLAPPSIKGIRDLSVYPQNGLAYVDSDKKGTPLVDSFEAKRQADEFFKQYFSPWRKKRTGFKRRDAMWGIARYGKSPGYDAHGTPNDPSWLAHAVQMADASHFPSMSRYGISLHNTNLRLLPTNRPRFDNPSEPGEGYPFDYLQNSALWANTPVFISHLSRDGQWYYVESAFAAGWSPIKDIGFVDDIFIGRFMTGRYVSIVRDKLLVRTDRGDITTHMGALFPVTAQSERGYRVLAAARASGGRSADAALARGAVAVSDGVLVPLFMTQKNVAVLANRMMNQAYGWGGLDEKRDCSATVRDLFTPFGIWLPRNSKAQAMDGIFISLQGLSPELKEQEILSKGVPFMTLVWLPGHIMLYMGQKDGRVVVFHNVWGLRTLTPEGEEGREVIGRTVVTSLHVGEENPLVGSDRILLNRVRGISYVAPPSVACIPKGRSFTGVQ